MDIIDVHMHGDGDNSPLQFISLRRLNYYRQLETLAREMIKTLNLLAQDSAAPTPTVRDPHAEKPDSP